METVERYQILAELGQGGMGTVYRALDTMLNREVALKLLSPYYRDDETFVRRFHREAQMVARLEHAYIVPVYDVGEYEGRPFLVMRLLPGGSLRERLEAGGMSQPDLWQTLRRVATALDAAHANQVIHRDVKPTNILFDEQGMAFVSDFGIAKWLDANTQLTGSAIVGSPAYMSPEQFKARGVDGHSDQYNLAIVVHEALTGDLPFSGDTVQLMYQHLESPPPLVHTLNSDFPPSISLVLARALAKKPSERFDTVLMFVEALEAAAIIPLGYMTESSMPAAIPKPVSQPAQLPKRNPKAKTGTTKAQRLGSAYSRGLEAWEQQDWETAVKAFEEVLATRPNHPKAKERYEKACYYLEQQKGEETTRAARHRISQPNSLQSSVTAHSSRRHMSAESRSRRSSPSHVVSGAGGEITQAISFYRRPWVWGMAIIVLAVIGLGIIWVMGQARAQMANDMTEETTMDTTVVVDTTVGKTADTGAIPSIVIDVPHATVSSAESTAEVYQGTGTYTLTNGGQLFLDKTAQVKVRGDNLLMTLGKGVLVVDANGQTVVVQNPYGAFARVEGGVLGIAYDEDAFIFEVACLRGSCRLHGDLGDDEVLLREGQTSIVGGSGMPGETTVTEYSKYHNLATNIVPAPTATSIPTKTPLPTLTSTATRMAVPPSPTATPTPTGPPDGDGDGIPDTQDKCPTEYWPWEQDGCPHEEDSDSHISEPVPEPTSDSGYPGYP